MSPYRAQRKHGACFGSLWKQHSSVTGPPNLLFGNSEESSKSNPISPIIEKSDKNTLTAALDGNERPKSQEFCVLVGNTLTSYENLTAFRRGDHPTSEVRIVGASAWNPPTQKRSARSATPPRAVSPSSASQGFETSTSKSKATGAPTFRLVTYAGTHIYCSAHTAADRNTWLSALHAGLEVSYTGYKETFDVFNAIAKTTGTACIRGNTTKSTTTTLGQKILTPPIPQRQARIQLLRQRIGKRNSISLPSSPITSSHGQSFSNPYESKPNSPISTKHCLSCGRFPPENAMRPSSTTPLPQYGMENRVNVCQPCLTAQGVLRHLMHLTALYASDAHSRAALAKAREMAVKTVKDAVLEEQVFLEVQNSKVMEKMHRKEVDTDDNVEVADLLGIHDSDGKSSANNVSSDGLSAGTSSWTNVGDTSTDNSSSTTNTSLSPCPPKNLTDTGAETDTDDNLIVEGEEANHDAANSPKKIIPSTLSGSWTNVDELSSKQEKSSSVCWVNLPPTPLTTTALLNLIQSPAFATYRQRSRVLDLNCEMLENGGMGHAAEFLEILDEHARDATTSTTAESQSHEIFMKKEALKVAGDMGSAIKLLQEHALSRTNGSNQSEMLACILEFFLDLCEEGEISSVAFFWPQLCQIHLQMLPPTDADTLVRVEMYEDFLLTVSVRYSVHLALELVWGCIADLEESLGSPNNASASCRRRRFSLLRFVCELESLLFDFDGGWGGGSVSLRGMLSPSDHQDMLIKEAMAVLQLHRRFSSQHLTKSARLEKLRSEAQDDKIIDDSLDLERGSKNKDVTLHGVQSSDLSDLDVATRKYKIARNAEYFSTQLMFSRRLGDIAERLRFMEVEKRSAALKHDLDALNASGRLGGDPLNQTCEGVNGLINVLHIPSMEGHVFRSKERTPVLLLMEIMKDESILHTSSDSQNKKGLMVSTPRGGKEGLSRSLNQQGANIENEEHVTGGEGEEDNMQTIDVAQVTEPESSLRLDNVNDRRKNDGSDSSSLRVDEPDTEKVSTLTESMGEIDSCCDDEDESNVKLNQSEVSNSTIYKPSVAVHQSENTPKALENVCDAENLMANMTKKEFNLDQPESCSPLQKSAVGKQSVQENMIEKKREDENHDAKVNIEDLSAPEISIGVHSPSENDLTEKVNDHNDIDLESRTVAPSIDEACKANLEEKRLQIKEENTVITPPASSTSSQRKISAFGPVVQNSNDQRDSFRSSLAAHGDGRREVLTTIFLKGMKSNNLIARGIAPLAQRAVQAMDHHRAVQLIKNATNVKKDQNLIKDTRLGVDEDKDCDISKGDYALSLALQTSNEITDPEKILTSYPSEEDECMESLRLVLIQNRVAQGSLSPENAARALASGKEERDVESSFKLKVSLREKDLLAEDNTLNSEPVDAGDIDQRLIGCGAVSQAVYNALNLWKRGIIKNGELLELVQKDLQFNRLALPGAENEDKLMEDSAFWGRFAFGERWAEKKARIQASSQYGSQPGWDLSGVIVKSNDDLRQEAFVMQLIQLCQEVFEMAGLELWVQPYRILATGRTTGIIEMVRNAMSFDSLKKRPGFNAGGLLGHFQRMTEFAADPDTAFKSAQKNFVRSLAAYSLLSYLFMFKDRHNGNILLDTAGHVIHIDFGFVFGIAPGGSFSLEQSAPFKLTEEMIEVMGGLGSPVFSEFVTLFCCGFLALQAHADTFLTIVEITSEGSAFNCFEGKNSNEIVSKLRERFCLKLDKESTVAYAMELIRQATISFGTKQYDYFQYLSNGIAS